MERRKEIIFKYRNVKHLIFYENIKGEVKYEIFNDNLDSIYAGKKRLKNRIISLDNITIKEIKSYENFLSCWTLNGYSFENISCWTLNGYSFENISFEFNPEEIEFGDFVPYKVGTENYENKEKIYHGISNQHIYNLTKKIQFLRIK